MTPGGVTCARLRLAHVTPPGVTSQNPHTLYTIYSVEICWGIGRNMSDESETRTKVSK